MIDRANTDTEIERINRNLITTTILLKKRSLSKKCLSGGKLSFKDIGFCNM
jgi:hypothetical protein